MGKPCRKSRKKEAKVKVVSKKVGQKRKKGKRGKKHPMSYLRYYRMLYDGRLDLSTSCVKVLDSFMSDIFERISSEASQLSRRSGRKTLTDRDMEAATKLIIGERPLVEGALKHARKALRKSGMKNVAGMPLNQEDSDSSECEESSDSSLFLSCAFETSSTDPEDAGQSTDYQTFIEHIGPNKRSSPIIKLTGLRGSRTSDAQRSTAIQSSASATFATPQSAPSN